MIKKSTAAIGSLLIAGVGYVAGVLTAPKSGRETRKDLRAAAAKAKSDAERKLKAAHSELTKLLDEAALFAKKAKGNADAEFKKVRAQAEKVRQKARELLSGIHEGEADDKDLQEAIDDVKKASAHLKKYLEKQNSSEATK